MNEPVINSMPALSVVMPTSWQGWFAPAGTPAAIVDRLHRDIRKTLELPSVRDVLRAGGYEPVGDSPAEFRKFIQSELSLFAGVAAKAKIKTE